MKTPKLVLVVPCFNEEQVLNETANRLKAIVTDLVNRKTVAAESYICFIDDGSNDKTWEIIESLNKSNGIIKGIRLSRNFGHQNALLAGLHKVKDSADCVISIDADLQQDENAIPAFIEKYKNGADIVLGIREDRKTDSYFKK